MLDCPHIIIADTLPTELPQKVPQILLHSNEGPANTPANIPANGPASSWKLVGYGLFIYKGRVKKGFVDDPMIKPLLFSLENFVDRLGL